MFGSAVLEIVIGLVLVYFVLSLFCSALNEWVARWTELRSKTLRSGIEMLLGDPARTQLAAAFHQHPLIRGLRMGRDSYPSYIPSRTFALAIIDLVMQP